MLLRLNALGIYAQPVLFGLFTVELIVRIACFSSFKNFMTSGPVNVIDFVSIMSFLFSQIVPSRQEFKVLGMVTIIHIVFEHAFIAITMITVTGQDQSLIDIVTIISPAAIILTIPELL